MDSLETLIQDLSKFMVILHGSEPKPEGYSLSKTLTNLGQRLQTISRQELEHDPGIVFKAEALLDDINIEIVVKKKLDAVPDDATFRNLKTKLGPLRTQVQITASKTNKKKFELVLKELPSIGASIEELASYFPSVVLPLLMATHIT